MNGTEHEIAKVHEGAITLTKDARLAVQFRTRKEAADAAKSIGWLAKDATRIDVMGFLVWTIGDDHCNYLTRTGFARERQMRGLGGYFPGENGEAARNQAAEQHLQDNGPVGSALLAYFLGEG